MLSMATNQQIIDMALRLGPTRTAQELNISTRWVYTLLARWRRHGELAYQPRSKRPLTNTATTDPHIQNRILELRHYLQQQGTDAGAETIAYWLSQEQLTPPSKATIHRILRRAGMVTDQPRKRPKSSYTSFSAALPNEIWQSDVTHAHLADASPREILSFLDDHSRYLVSIHAYKRVTAATVAEQFRTTCHHHGKPANTLTNNGLIFTARFAGKGEGNAKNVFEKQLHTWGINQINGRPGHPQTQGKIERFHQTLKRWLTAQPTPQHTRTLNDQ